MKNIKFKIYAKLIIVEIIVLIAMRFLVPILANYPPYSEISHFQLKVEMITHDVQYLFLGLLAVSLHLIFINVFFKNIFKYLKRDTKDTTLEETKKIRKQCYAIPKKLITIQLILLVLMLLILFTMVDMSFALCVKFLLIYFSFFMATWVISIVLIKKDLNKIIEYTYNNYTEYEMPDKKTMFYKTLIYNLFPLFIVVIVGITLFGYATTTDKVGEGIYYYYKQSLKDINLDNLSIEEVCAKLNQIEFKNKDDYYFIINDNLKITSNIDANISNFFIEYAKEFIETTDGRIYEYYGIEEEAYVIKTKLKTGENVFIGFKYLTTSQDVVMPFIIISIFYTLLYITILIIWSKNISKNISNVSEQLINISENSDVEQETILPILSQDEIGELSNAYNKIQKLTNEQIRKLKEDEEKIREQTELNTLGELAGGIAHDLNSPLMAVSLNIETLKKYINSDRIETNDETKEKLTRMLETIDKALKNMGETINSVKNQIRASGDTSKSEISLLDLLEQIRILNSSKFRNCNCKFINDISKNIYIFGERNKLDRIITNIINNSLDAYSENNIKGDIVIDLSEDNEFYIISINDKAGGIKKEIQSKLLQENITTKGKKGTGIGVRNSNNLLVTAFNGKLTFKSEENVETTFYIKIPKNIVKEGL
ncbi:MAG: HAMP domain-containing sensor histidine kinase [Clostridia bacterium]|nr:HAMP domain-containing sensor histidine kinase [Clostridia bacterium]